MLLPINVLFVSTIKKSTPISATVSAGQTPTHMIFQIRVKNAEILLIIIVCRMLNKVIFSE